MYYSQFNKFDTMNGPGVRVSLFVSGCTLACPGCFNREAWNFRHGMEFTPDVMRQVVEAVSDKYVAGLSILGGDPLEPKNIGTVIELCRTVKRMHPDKTIWVWTGRTIENVVSDRLGRELVETIDVLVDGPFEQRMTEPGLKYKGSSNQRVIQIKQLYENQQIIRNRINDETDFIRNVEIS